MSPVNARLVQRVRRRAHGCCEYCQSQERVVGEAFTLDHIIPHAKAGGDTFQNLALCCYVCNPLKGAKTEAPDPQTGNIVSLFHPRRQRWSAHFSWSDDGLFIIGKTPVGRATVAALKLNRPSLLLARQTWVQWGVHPPYLPS
jgi:hypothetical protein